MTQISLKEQTLGKTINKTTPIALLNKRTYLLQLRIYCLLKLSWYCYVVSYIEKNYLHC